MFNCNVHISTLKLWRVVVSEKKIQKHLHFLPFGQWEGAGTYMMTSSNWNIFRWIPCTKASDAELWYFLWYALNERLSKQSCDWLFETPSLPLWRYSNDNQSSRKTPCATYCSVLLQTICWRNKQCYLQPRCSFTFPGIFECRRPMGKSTKSCTVFNPVLETVD